MKDGLSITHRRCQNNLCRDHTGQIPYACSNLLLAKLILVNVTGLNFTGFVEIWGDSKVSSSFIKPLSVKHFNLKFVKA